MKEKRYFIYAYDITYGGLHGMYSYCFEECSSADAELLGREMSYDVINSYDSIYDLLIDEEMSEEEIEEAYEEDIAYEVWELRDGAPSFLELEAMNLDPISYIEEYCRHE
jgi:hypothetical protein